ncbi:putative norsolorinic acid reductase [Diaporthe ampelina]|uniref:Putative norsolorinic acid reductase n=1 Tax=Diaporthe ampelina TaxID=1214573 RepID=A0A0G2HV99_9PEZI|nr:putative norsolorinic acid reductase [Diaporthe ampelina]
MNFGKAWESYMGACDQKTTEGILDYFYEQGGNFIDTANNYQFGESETWIGEWMKKRGNRDEMVIATKYTTNFMAGPPGEGRIMANFTGNGTKSLHTSLKASLKKLDTDYIDLLYVHWWDFSVSIPELMQSLNNLVIQGKVLYLGVSDTPAWVVSKANQYARDHGLRQFCVYQGRWNAESRDFEREIIPMCREEGMGLAPWGALGGGSFKTEEQRKSQEGRKVQVTEQQIKISGVLEQIANRKNTAITSVALAYVMHKTPYVFPIVGGRTTNHLKANIEALKLHLSHEDLKEIEGAVPFDPGFPNTFFYQGQTVDHPGEVWLLGMAGKFDYVPLQEAITPAEN